MRTAFEFELAVEEWIEPHHSNSGVQRQARLRNEARYLATLEALAKAHTRGQLRRAPVWRHSRERSPDSEEEERPRSPPTVEFARKLVTEVENVIT